jgi:hypothetical protein
MSYRLSGVARRLNKGLSSWRITGVVLLAALVQGLALWLFCKGFLLSRIAVPLVSSANVPVIQLPRSAEGEPRIFSRAVIIIVDALRLDFLVERPYSRQGNHVASMKKVLHLAESLV